MLTHNKLMALLTFLVVPLALRAEWLYRRLPRLTPTAADGPLPSLSIIVPARNEAANLHRLLPSLQAQQYPGPLEIIVVDDNSDDNTAVVADYYGANLVSLTDLPPGWLGKPHALYQGVQASTGDWLLFSDADMFHTPFSAVSAMSYALENNLDGLSLFPKQKPLGLLDRLILMVAFAGLFAGLHPNSPVLNGQYVLLKKEAYAAIGGMTAVRQEMLEDLALGRRLQQFGFQVPIMRGEKIAEVFMYDNLRQCWYGMNRLGSGSLKFAGAGAILTFLLITGAMMPLVAPVLVSIKLVNKRWLGLTWLATVPGFLTWGQRFGSTYLGLLAPFGAAFVQLAACWGFVTRLLGRGILWKNRTIR